MSFEWFRKCLKRYDETLDLEYNPRVKGYSITQTIPKKDEQWHRGGTIDGKPFYGKFIRNMKTYILHLKANEICENVIGKLAKNDPRRFNYYLNNEKNTEQWIKHQTAEQKKMNEEKDKDLKDFCDDFGNEAMIERSLGRTYHRVNGLRK